MHVLVAGAGIAGAAAALALGNQGHRVTVLERAPAARDGGCAIVLWSNGTAVLKDLGVDPTALGERIEAVDVYSARGRALMSVDTTRLETRFDAPVLGVPRRNLHRRLLRDLPEEILHYGARLTHVHEGEDHVRVRTSEGREYTADLLIGADGVNSAVRAALPGPLSEAETTGQPRGPGPGAVAHRPAPHPRRRPEPPRPGPAPAARALRGLGRTRHHAAGPPDRARPGTLPPSQTPGRTPLGARPHPADRRRRPRDATHPGPGSRTGVGGRLPADPAPAHRRPHHPGGT
ncbi:FAD binding domain protein [Nocardiopsis alba ATCC BAA-2165]|uniref:FAD binding domain protein n=1 Tax=Nocardiopsis alba (strain ATCC BAA-2165 / BE74) TaxID=1205910 RepID=J7L978_NOCAA|nr:FAD binding domain protein [Nocardiopsis alba ATCC BAA-2165]